MWMTFVFRAAVTGMKQWIVCAHLQKQSVLSHLITIKKENIMYRERQTEWVRVCEREREQCRRRCLLSIYLLERVCQRVWLVFYLCRWSGWAVFVAFTGNYPAGVALATADSRSPLQTAWHIDFLLWGVLFKPHLRFPSRPRLRVRQPAVN